jgi:hypothetical protein
MGWSCRVCFLLGMWWLTPVGAALARPDTLLGDWTVIDAACSGCRDVNTNDAGTRLRIGETSVENPFGSDCAGRVMVERRSSIDPARTLRRLALPRAWTPQGHDAEGGAYQATVICAGADHGEFLVLSDQIALLRYEGGMFIRLRRVR